MPRTDALNTPDAVWDHHKQVCYDPITHALLPNYEGLCLFTGGREPMVMNTWLVAGQRKWDLVCLGYCVSNKVLDEALKKAS